MKKLKILLTNDDGIDARGIQALYKELTRFADVTVVAPNAERSAVGHAITISDPLRVYEYEHDAEYHGFAVTGTPADCVKIGVKCLMSRPPDAIVSGINHGSNTATNVIYSGTVSAATEGTIMGFPSVASSITTFDLKVDLCFAAEFTAKIVRLVLENGLPKGTLLNLNIPAVSREKIRGVQITRQGKGKFEEYFDKRVDPVGRVYYWLAGKKMILDEHEDIDDVTILNNKISVCPIHYDLTNHEMLETLKQWNIEL